MITSTKLKTMTARAFWIAAICTSAQVCYASPMVSLVGDLNHASLTDSSTTGKWGLGGGLLVELPLSEYWGFELGGLDVPRSINQLGTLQYVKLPFELRHWLCHHVVIGAGGYYAQSIGDASAFSNAGLKTSDYGVLASIGVQKHLVPGFAVLAEGRYDYSLNNVAQFSAAGPSHWSEFQVLFGFRIGMMEK